MNKETTEELKDMIHELEKRIETLEDAIGRNNLRKQHRIKH